MENTAHDQIKIRFTPPPRTFVLILGSVLVGVVALFASDVGGPPIASAQTTYNLCDRTTAVRDALLFALQYPNRTGAATPGHGQQHIFGLGNVQHNDALVHVGELHGAEHADNIDCACI